MRNNEKLMKLKAVDSIKTDIQAVCYVNSEDKETNIVVRGSGGDNEAWQENTNLAYEYETRLQKNLEMHIKNGMKIMEGLTMLQVIL